MPVRKSKSKQQLARQRSQRRRKLIDSADKANKIMKGLWLGDEDASSDYKFLKNNKITVVINATMSVPNKFSKRGITYIRVPLDDSLKMVDINKMTAYLPYIIQTLRRFHVAEKKNILVHCHAGMQRSAIIVASYLCRYYKMTPDKAIKKVIEKRPVAFLGGESINFGDSIKTYYANLKRFHVI